MKIVNTLQHYVRFGYKTFVVDNFVLDDPSDFEEVLKGEYVYKNSKLFKALKNTVSSLKNLEDRNIFIEVQAYSDVTPETSKEKKDNEITKNVQKSKTTEIKKTEDVKVEKVEEVATELAESTEQKDVNFNQLKSKKKR